MQVNKIYCKLKREKNIVSMDKKNWKELRDKMKKGIILLILCVFLGITGCNSKEEAMAVITQVPCQEADVVFSLNGLWNIQEDGQENSNVTDGQKVGLSAYNEETGSVISVIYYDLKNTEGGTLTRMEDYIEAVQKNLKTAEDYSYACSEITSEELYGNSYETFTATVSDMDARQQLYFRRKEDTVIVITFTVFGEEKLDEILALGKEM